MDTIQNTQIANTATTNNMVTMTIKEFAQKHGFVSINKAVAENTNGYPFLTFINANNEAENVYFAKTIAADYPAEMLIGKEHFAKLQIGETYNAEGEVRIKLIPVGGNRTSLADLFD